MGTTLETAERMGEEVWNILMIKLEPTMQTVLAHAAFEGFTALTRTTRVWFELLRSSKGSVADRRWVLSGAVNRPVQAKTWTKVPEAIRQWEMNMMDLERLTGTRILDEAKIHALPHLLPNDL